MPIGGTHIKINGILQTVKKSLLDKTRLLKIDELQLSEQTISEFEDIYTREILSTDQASNITYNSKYPLYMFLNFVLEKKDIVIHGSNNSMIDTFVPRNSLLFNGKPIKAVFASSDGVWALFFAVRKRKEYVGSIRNLCYSIHSSKGIKRYYYFSINHKMPKHWTNGTIYFFSKKFFSQGGVVDEWVCENEVKPLAKLSVTPEDFPFLEKVRSHKETDSVIKTLIKALFYKK